MIVEIIVGDCLSSLRAIPAQSVHTCVTSPPYFGLRDYGHGGQIGQDTSKLAIPPSTKVEGFLAENL